MASDVERRPHTQYARHEQPGRTTVVVVCPFCAASVLAYVWSLAGSGKRCTCGALHTATESIRRSP